MSDYAVPQSRRKRKDKRREKKNHPYKKGGRLRSSNVGDKK